MHVFIFRIFLVGFKKFLLFFKATQRKILILTNEKNPVNFGAFFMVFWGVGILFVQKCSLKACNFCVRVIIKLPLALGMPTNALALARGASQAKRARPHFLAPLFSATQQSVAYSCPLCILHMYTRVYLATRRAKQPGLQSRPSTILRMRVQSRFCSWKFEVRKFIQFQK